MKVIVDPYLNIYYSAFYLEELCNLFGEKNVKFSTKPFQKIAFKNRIFGLCFVLEKDNTTKKYVVNFDDSYQINESLYNWCDVYGSVNTNFAKTPEKYHKKLVALTPSFGVKMWSLPKTIYYAISNLIKLQLNEKQKFNIKRFLGKYKKMYQLRLPISEYQPKEIADKSYVFHLSTLWYSDEWNKNDEGVNKTRANFIRACKSIEGINFDGGLVSQGKTRSSEELFKDCLFSGAITIKSWLQNTQKSLLVFNTPAFWNCHGWKLGEYLALGKAIISTQIFNDLPYPLEHGVNIHFVENNEKSIKEAVTYILNNEEYRLKLEKGAKEYWNKYGTARQSLSLLGIKS